VRRAAYMFRDVRGFGLIELTILIVVVGVLAAVAMQSASVGIDDSRQIATQREMKRIADAIVGDPNLMSAGTRADFGYVGDIGAFPSSLNDLITNPGGYSTWDGPYVRPGIDELNSGITTDEWGSAYVYSGGVTISSTGGGNSINWSFGSNTSDFLLNSISGSVADSAGEPPGVDWADSVAIEIEIPNGLGGRVTKSYSVAAIGSFTIDSVPIGIHPVRAVFLPTLDSLNRFVTVIPRHKDGLVFRFARDFASDTASSPDSSSFVVSTTTAATLASLSMSDVDIAEYFPELQTSTMFFDADTLFGGNENIDAFFVDTVGNMYLSTATGASIGGVSFDDDDIVKVNMFLGGASIYADGSTMFSGNENIDGVHVFEGGNMLLSTENSASIAGISINDEDIVFYDPVADTAAIIFDGSAIIAGQANVNGVAVADDGRLIITCDGTSESIGALSFADEDLVYYDSAAGVATMMFDGDVPFGATSIDIDAVSITPEITPPDTLLWAEFDSDEEGFTYLDDAFRGTSQPNYASGSYLLTGGYSGGGIATEIGAIDQADILNMSGGWRESFTMPYDGTILLSLRYNLTTTAEYENDENCEALVSVDGTLYGVSPNDYLYQIIGDGPGGSQLTSGWVNFTITIGSLSAGAHTITVGGYNNKKTTVNESMEVVFDNIYIIAWQE